MQMAANRNMGCGRKLSKGGGGGEGRGADEKGRESDVLEGLWGGGCTYVCSKQLLSTQKHATRGRRRRKKSFCSALAEFIMDLHG